MLIVLLLFYLCLLTTLAVRRWTTSSVRQFVVDRFPPTLCFMHAYSFSFDALTKRFETMVMVMLVLMRKCVLSFCFFRVLIDSLNEQVSFHVQRLKKKFGNLIRFCRKCMHCIHFSVFFNHYSPLICVKAPSKK